MNICTLKHYYLHKITMYKPNYAQLHDSHSKFSHLTNSPVSTWSSWTIALVSCKSFRSYSLTLLSPIDAAEPNDGSVSCNLWLLKLHRAYQYN